MYDCLPRNLDYTSAYLLTMLFEILDGRKTKEIIFLVRTVDDLNSLDARYNGFVL